jgi:hypothetical protein
METPSRDLSEEPTGLSGTWFFQALTFNDTAAVSL